VHGQPCSCKHVPSGDTRKGISSTIAVMRPGSLSLDDLAILVNEESRDLSTSFCKVREPVP